MKKILLSSLISIVCVFTFVCSSYAQAVMTVSGNEYSVIILCRGDAGDYCQQNDFTQDTFQFHSDGSFEINSLEDKKELIDTSDGDYNALSLVFNGDYTVTIDYQTKKYEFTFIGFSIGDVLILGQLNVKYYAFGGFPPGYDQKGEAQAFFLGFRK